jgi:hypothetical protein
MTKAYLIDSAAREVREVEHHQNQKPTLQDHLGGYIEVAWSWSTGEVCYVDEEGLFKPQRGGYWLAGRPDQPMVGNGIVVGREVEDDAGFHTEPPSFSLDFLRAQVVFITRADIDAWAKGNRSPGVAFTGFDAGGGLATTEVIATMGEIYGEMPSPSYPVVVDSFGAQIIGEATTERDAALVLRTWYTTERPGSGVKIVGAEVGNVLMGKNDAQGTYEQAIQAWIGRAA